MTDIVENPANYPANVPLLDVGDEVRGGVSGASNKQAIALADRTAFLKAKTEQIEQTISGLDANDVGADPQGTSSSLIQSHEADADPHPQYELKTDAATKYLSIAGANVPNGWAKLDANGKIPSSLLDMVQSNYITVADEAARLALPATDNLTIAVQLDLDQLFYLNGGLDPSVAANWQAGQSATVSGVSRVFGRSGNVVAENGDYNADQITETTTRTFTTPTERNTWNAKQDRLVSGGTIKTFKGLPILGAGDINPTPDQLGCAEKNHSHPTTNIVGLDASIKATIGSNIIPGQGISVNYNNVTGRTTIAASVVLADGVSGYVVSEQKNSIANQTHVYTFSPLDRLGYAAFALKSEPGSINQVTTIETFDSGNVANYNVSSGVIFNGSMELFKGETVSLSPSNGLFKADMKTDVDLLNIIQRVPSIVPRMSANNVPAGYVASASSSYDSGYLPFRAFDQSNNGGAFDGWATANIGSPTPAAPAWLRIDLPAPVKITGYGIQNRFSGAIQSINRWQLQGSTDNGVTWEDIGAVVQEVDGTPGKIRKHLVSPIKAYSSYRLFITGGDTSNPFIYIQEWELYDTPNMMLLDADGTTGYSIVNNALVAYPNVTAEQIDANGFVNYSGLTSAMLANKTIKGLVASRAATVDTTANPGPQIALPKTPRVANMWATINGVAFTRTQTGGGLCNVAVSRNGTEWFVFSGNAWVSIGELTPDRNGATKLANSGMTATAMTAVTQAQWAAFFPNGAPDTICFAYALRITALTDVAKYDTVNVTADNRPAFRIATPAEVDIRWDLNYVSFKTIVAGDYVFAYQQP